MNWTATYIKCPERHFNFWNISLEILCLAGVFINFVSRSEKRTYKLIFQVLFRRFFGDLKKSVFLLNLASCDMGLCFPSFSTHFFASCAMFLQSDILAEIQVFLCLQRNTLNYFDYLFENILIFYIVVERFLWTCTSKTRKSWKIFAVGKYKMRLTVITILFFIGATMIYIWKLEVSSWNRFCETHIYSSQYERPFLRFLVNVFFPLIPYASLLLTLIFALLTLCRLTRIGRGEGPVTEEDRELAVVLGLTNRKISRSILCMLMVYLTFVIRFAVHYIFLPASLREMYLKETIQQRNSRKWKIDMLNVVFFLSRMIIYKMICGKDQIVVEYAPNALIYF
ncbi:hypothetical protein CRE_24969 [Caenorhabditis remanei]|uniref:G-protein coupled receptors family 1 profile domain-containing protein n=1 Tax=Caenorhabditis remanei TaxID=31234 RepID=E3MHP1_CAERE|nr:hypothetical protein CRE_24969 [Caenorhabditis remanei]